MKLFMIKVLLGVFGYSNKILMTILIVLFVSVIILISGFIVFCIIKYSSKINQELTNEG